MNASGHIINAVTRPLLVASTLSLFFVAVVVVVRRGTGHARHLAFVVVFVIAPPWH